MLFDQFRRQWRRQKAIDPDEITLHSLRIGGATTLAADGSYPNEGFKERGGGSSTRARRTRTIAHTTCTISEKGVT